MMGSQRLNKLMDAWYDDPVVKRKWQEFVSNGNAYRSWYRTPAGDTLAKDATLDVVLQFGTHAAHIFGVYSTGGDADLDTYVGVNYDEDGTILPKVNLNGTSSNTSDLVLRLNPTINAVGVINRQQYIPGAKGEGSIIPGSILDVAPIIPAGLAVLARLTNTSAAGYRVGVEIFWHDHVE